MNYVPIYRKTERICTECGQGFLARELTAQTLCLKCLLRKEKP